MNHQNFRVIFLFNLLSYRLLQYNCLLKPNKIMVYLISEQSEEIYHNSAFLILHSALIWLCTLHFFALINYCPYYIINAMNYKRASEYRK